MDNTKATVSPSSSAQSINMQDYQPFEEPQIKEQQSAHEHVPFDTKAIYITLSKILKGVSVHIDLKSLEESERIRRINEMIDRNK